MLFFNIGADYDLEMDNIFQFDCFVEWKNKINHDECDRYLSLDDGYIMDGVHQSGIYMQPELLLFSIQDDKIAIVIGFIPNSNGTPIQVFGNKEKTDILAIRNKLEYVL